MTTKHLTPDEFATYLIGDAIRRKIAAGLDGYGPLGTELNLLRRWVDRGLVPSELAAVRAIVPALELDDIAWAETQEPERPKSADAR